MSLIERFLHDELFIDFGSEILYGDDQMYLDYPCRFAIDRDRGNGGAVLSCRINGCDEG